MARNVGGKSMVVENIVASHEDTATCLSTLEAAAKLCDALQSQLTAIRFTLEALHRRHETSSHSNLPTDSIYDQLLGDQMTNLLTAPEVAKHLGVTRQTLWRIRKRGNFPEPVQGMSSRMVRFLASDIERWMRGSEPFVGDQRRA